MLIFDQNLKIPVLTDKNCSNIEGKIFPSHICQKWDIYWQKNLKGVSYKLQILHTTKLTRAQKKPQNNFFTPGPQHGENGF